MYMGRNEMESGWIMTIYHCQYRITGHKHVQLVHDTEG